LTDYIEYDSDANNRDIDQNNNNQQLSQAEIEQMKLQGLEGQLASEVSFQILIRNIMFIGCLFTGDYSKSSRK
jgi:hypothetical protein